MTNIKKELFDLYNELEKNSNDWVKNALILAQINRLEATHGKRYWNLWIKEKAQRMTKELFGTRAQGVIIDDRL